MSFLSANQQCQNTEGISASAYYQDNFYTTFVLHYVHLLSVICALAKGNRPMSAVSRPDVDPLSAVASHRLLNGSVDAARPTAGSLGDSAVGLHRAVLYLLGERSQMKVRVACDRH